MIRVTDGRVEVTGPMVMVDASRLLADGEAAIAQQATSFDLSGVTDMDSSCLAVIFGWMRAARDAGSTVSLVNPPPNLLSLAEVYGVTDLLPAT